MFFKISSIDQYVSGPNLSLLYIESKTETYHRNYYFATKNVSEKISKNDFYFEIDIN